MVRIAHVSDTHLGFRQYNLDEREQDIYDIMDEIANKIIEERAEIVIHSGDLFDSPKPTAQAYYAFKNFLTRLNGKVKFFSILGDHDTPKRRGMPPQKLFDDRIRILGIAGEEHQLLHLNGQDVLIAGISNIGRRYREILIEELGKLNSIAASYPVSILALHQAIDRFFTFEEAFELRMDELPRNFNYYAMGHLHNRVQESFGRGKLAYSGSTEIIRSDEISEWGKNGKGFYIVDIDGSEVNVRRINLERIRPQLKVKINYANFDQELKGFIASLRSYLKPPLIHVVVEGRNIDRQKVQQTLSKVLSGKTLYFRSQVAEEAEREVISLKPGGADIRLLLKEYLRNEEIAEFSWELFKALRLGDVEEAKKIAGEYFRRLRQNDIKKGIH